MRAYCQSAHTAPPQTPAVIFHRDSGRHVPTEWRERGMEREEVRVIQIESVEEREDRNIKGRGRKKEK